MKFNKTKSTLSLAAAMMVSSVHAQGSALELEPTYYNDFGFKNIAFFSAIGGSSHYTWVLSISDELGKRGHNVTYLTNDKDVKFGKPYKHVKTVSIGPPVDYTPEEITSEFLRDIDTVDFMTMAFGFIHKHFERDYEFTRDYFIANNIDLALCDHFAEACVEAATSLNIPYIVTSAMEITKDSAAPYINNNIVTLTTPTSEFQSFVSRFENKFIKPIKMIRKLMPFFKQLNERKKSIGIDAKIQDPSTKWQNALKLVNNIHGFSPARPMGPLVELVGPIIPKQYAPLNEPLEQFLSTHKRVAYVAFGQTATPSEADIKLIMTTLLECIERDILDSFLWATVNAAGNLPDTITTSSGTVYHTQAMINHTNPHARFVSWAPQTAVLLHPSTALFVSHGGLGSWYESLYAGKRMMMFPFFGDQPVNALIIEQSNYGGIFKHDFTMEQAIGLVKRLMEDKDGKIKSALERGKALVQTRSKNSVIRGADAVEEVAYTHNNGILEHRISADRRMSYIKAHNLDLYGAFIALVGTVLYVVVFVSFRIVSYLKPSQIKLKTQ